MSTDAIVLLKEDHKEIKRLFREFERADDARSRSEKADEIVRALTVHTYLEDEVMYPRIRAEVPDLAEEMDQAHQEHHVADLLCAEIADMDGDHPELVAKVAVLADAVTRHIDTEEHDWFPRVREALGRKRLQDIGERLLTVGRTAPRRPERPTVLQKVADALSQ
ncbi:hemerythrin domain-containing protein [Kitasatospora sp. NPDC059571]|uniref:hemerythrin domain-containing protein n=1 Tax=Kitasatospora sp. NPDC059571 TaxID=3346871 RepID=UPI0036A8BD64